MKLSDFIREHPQLDAEMGNALAEIATEVVHLDRVGSLRLGIRLEKKGSRVMTTIAHSAVPPKPDPEAGLFFVGRDGKSLTKDDPYQLTTDHYDPDTGEIKEEHRA